MKVFDLNRIIRVAKDRFILPPRSIHGPRHWQRVRENGLRLARQTGADSVIVEVFSFLHDCCREDDGFDADHGPRAAQFARTLRDNTLNLSDGDFDLLYEAIHDHTHGHRHSHPTIGTCWDSDRLDIGRVGPKPHARYMSTKAAMDKQVIQWAWNRSRHG